MRVAVTGASGYVGGRILEAFRMRGHEVLTWSRRPCDGNWHRYDLGEDPASLPWSGVDALVHASYDFEPRTWSEIVERNVRRSIALLHAATKAGVTKLVFISSISSFDGTRSNYGKAKLMVEKTALEMGAAVIRPGLVWGAHSGGVMGSLEKLVTRLPVVPFLCGRGGIGQFLVHEQDLSRAVVSITENHHPDSGAIHEVAHPFPVPLLSILRTLAARSGKSPLFVPLPWQLAMFGLTAAERLGARPLFRSDSLTGLVYRAESLQHSTPPQGIVCRPFG